MNTAALAPDLLTWIDFKWLMAMQGERVHVERLQTDREYALLCLRRGAESRNATLRTCACRLLATLER